MCLRPAEANTGIVFFRTDVESSVEIPACVTSVTDTLFSTTLGKGNVKISTVEHLLSAAFGLGIDNLYVDVDSNEIPIMDGSSKPFIFLMQSAGIKELDSHKKFARIKKAVMVEKGDKWIRCEPYNGFKVSFTMEFEHPALKGEVCRDEIDFSEISYINVVSRARTFGFLKDLDKLQELNLARGGNLQNTVVFDEKKIMNQGGLRYMNECVKHKILDVIGDLYLFNHYMLGSFEGYKSGHELNNMLLSRLLKETDSWEEVVLPKDHMVVQYPLLSTS